MQIYRRSEGGGIVPPRTEGERDEIANHRLNPSDHYCGGSGLKHSPPLVIEGGQCRESGAGSPPNLGDRR